MVLNVGLLLVLDSGRNGYRKKEVEAIRMKAEKTERASMGYM